MNAVNNDNMLMMLDHALLEIRHAIVLIREAKIALTQSNIAHTAYSKMGAVECALENAAIDLQAAGAN